MSAVGITFGLLLAAVLVVVSFYFIWRQRRLRQAVDADPRLEPDQRAYYAKQSRRRLFGAVLLILLAVMLVGSLFLDYDPLQLSEENVPQVDEETAKQATRFLVFYFMSMLLILMVILAFAVLDFWATARFGMQQQKRLFEEHQQALGAELAAHKQRQSDLN